jgi:hypothetical protein
MNTLASAGRNLFVLGGAILLLCACGDGGGTPADKLGVAAECAATTDCNTDDNLVCLTQFKGGYCGQSGCAKTEDCPTGAVCITHDDQNNYCFRSCVDKVDCNANRGPDNEANCSSSVTFADGNKAGKVCVPPTGS